MKKVWILERFETKEEVASRMKEFEEMLESAKASDDAKGVEDMERIIRKCMTMLEQNPEGYWIGTEGKSIYNQFCDTAKAAIRRHPKGTKFRVVEGEIKDDAKYWCGYRFVKENEGVLRYLMATK